MTEKKKTNHKKQGGWLLDRFLTAYLYHVHRCQISSGAQAEQSFMHQCITSGRNFQCAAKAHWFGSEHKVKIKPEELETRPSQTQNLRLAGTHISLPTGTGQQVPTGTCWLCPNVVQPMGLGQRSRIMALNKCKNVYTNSKGWLWWLRVTTRVYIHSKNTSEKYTNFSWALDRWVAQILPNYSKRRENMNKILAGWVVWDFLKKGLGLFCFF